MSDLGPLPDIYVGIKREYLVNKFGDNTPNPSGTVEDCKASATAPATAPAPTPADPVADASTTAGETAATPELQPKLAATSGKSNPDQMSKKNKRKFMEAKMKEDRLCSGFIINNVCPFGDKCRYNHDIRGYLERKEKDLTSYLTSYCPNFHAYGYCSYGLQCRFGDMHIDREKCQNICRSEADGGVVPGRVLNTLDKHVQVQLRKKCYGKAPKTPHTAAVHAAAATDATAATTSTDGETAPAAAADATAAGAVPQTVFSNKDEYTAIRLKNNPVASHNFYRTNVADEDRSRKFVDFSTKKVYVAPLTTVGNLPFRRILKHYGADVTCGEMAMINNLENGQSSEWALLRRHEEEDCFGIQLAGSRPDEMKRVCNILEKETSSNFIDLNCGCPIDVLCDRGCGAALMNRPPKIVEVVNAMTSSLSRSVTVKLRIGWDEKNPNIHKILPMLQASSKGKIAAFFVHGRSRLQRYSRLAHWNIVQDAVVAQHDAWMDQFYSTAADQPLYPLVPLIGNGDIMSWHDWKSHQDMMDVPENWKEPDAAAVARLDEYVKSSATREAADAREMVVSEMRSRGLLGNTAMIGRGALIKPWLPKEIHDKCDYDIPSSERMEMLQMYVNYGLEYWGSDNQGVETTRRFLLEWLSFLHRYVPTGLCDRAQRMNQRPLPYKGRNDIESLLASPDARDWIRISELFLGNVDENFHFEPKHKSNSYISPTVMNSIMTGNNTNGSINLPSGGAAQASMPAEGECLEEEMGNG